MLGRIRAELDRFAGRLRGRRDPVILMYHRVARAPVDPWNLAVEPALFDQQMEILARTRHPVPLDWLAAELKAGRRPKGAVAVTFDDAYRDVLTDGKPSLARHGVPATVFVVSSAIGSERGFWWDELADMVLGGTALPARLATPFPVPDLEAALAKHSAADAHLALWTAARGLAPADRDAQLEAVAAGFGLARRSAAPVMSSADLLSLTAGGLVTLGVHTASHPSLPTLSREAQRSEIAACKAALEDLTGEPNRRLAYPFGDFDQRSLDLAAALGFDYAVSVRAGPANDWKDRFQLPRHEVRNWPGPSFARRLAWFGYASSPSS